MRSFAKVCTPGFSGRKPLYHCLPHSGTCIFFRNKFVSLKRNMTHLKATLNDIEVHGSNFANTVLIFYILWWMLWLRSLHRWCWAVVVKVVVDLPRKECLALLAEYSASVSKDWCGLVWWIMMYMIMYAQQAPLFLGSWSIFYNMSLYYIIIVNISIHIIKYHTNLSNEIAIPKN